MSYWKKGGGFSKKGGNVYLASLQAHSQVRDNIWQLKTLSK